MTEIDEERLVNQARTIEEYRQRAVRLALQVGRLTANLNIALARDVIAEEALEKIRKPEQAEKEAK